MSSIKQDLVDIVKIYSKDPFDPVYVSSIPQGWTLHGKGNFAAVFSHPSLKGKVVKIYAENRNGIVGEITVYKKLGEHKAYSELEEYGERYLVLKKLDGITLYQAFKKGVFIPNSVISDVDKAINYAIQRGLNPTDIHGKNVIMNNGHGYIVDVSDFLKPYSCPKWKHFKFAYYTFYLPVFRRLHISLPNWFLERIRKGYQLYLRISGFRKKQKNLD